MVVSQAERERDVIARAPILYTAMQRNGLFGGGVGGLKGAEGGLVQSGEAFQHVCLSRTVQRNTKCNSILDCNTLSLFYIMHCNVQSAI